MFFIGIFSSPLPYMFLVAVYLSGYAFFFFEGHTSISEADNNNTADGWIAPAISQPADNTETCFFYEDNLPFADAAPTPTLPFYLIALSAWVQLPETHDLYWHLPGQYSIRPPPLA